MITPGQWQLAAGERGEPMTRDHPGTPDQPPYIYVVIGDQEVMIAQVMDTTLWQNIEGEPDEVPFGEPEDTAKLMTFSPVLLRFVQYLASHQDGSGYTTRETSKRALELIKQLNEVEARNDADR